MGASQQFGAESLFVAFFCLLLPLHLPLPLTLSLIVFPYLPPHLHHPLSQPPPCASLVRPAVRDLLHFRPSCRADIVYALLLRLRGDCPHHLTRPPLHSQNLAPTLFFIFPFPPTPRPNILPILCDILVLMKRKRKQTRSHEC
jgi:hypothetical protein